jgi:hypothetical protein
MLKAKFVLGSAAAVLLLAAGPSRAQMPNLSGPPAATGDVQVSVLTNTEKGYQIGSPAGWKVVNGEGLDYALISPDNTAMCMASSGAVPDIAAIPEAEVRAAMSSPLGEEFWNNSFFGDMANKKYVHVGADANHPGGWPVQTVEATADLNLEGKTVPTTFAGLMTFKSAMAFQVMCFSASADFEAAKPSFNAVLQSFHIIK